MQQMGGAGGGMPGGGDGGGGMPDMATMAKMVSFTLLPRESFVYIYHLLLEGT